MAQANSFEAMDDLDCQGDQPTPEKQAETRYEQAHYKCEPATTIEELEAVARFAKSSSCASFRTAVKLARGSASPAESLMFAVLGAPMRFGGFGCCSLPMGGLLLNYRVDFDTLAVNMSSGIPYAICDFCPAAGVDNEYNGIGHELQNARIHDGNRNNGLKAMGIHVLVINRDQMKDLVALEAFAQTMHRLAGVRFRYRIKGYRKHQAGLAQRPAPESASRRSKRLLPSVTKHLPVQLIQICINRRLIWRWFAAIPAPITSFEDSKDLK